MDAVRTVAVAALLALSGCVQHPVGPARTYGAYEAKARTTASSARSAVATTRLLAEAGDRNIGPYASVTVSQQEEALSGVQGTFGSIQPPDERADQLRDELDGLLSRALDDVTQVRVAVRRGQLVGLPVQPLRDDEAALTRFIEAHQ